MINPVIDRTNRVHQAEPSAAQINSLVDRFYNKVRAEPLLATLFESRVSNWSLHQEKMTGFWRSVLLGTKEYKGHLMAVHASLPGLAPEHYKVWLELFDQAMRDTLPLEAIPYTQYIAQRFARAMQLGLFPSAEPVREQAPLFSTSKNNHHKAAQQTQGQQGIAPC